MADDEIALGMELVVGQAIVPSPRLTGAMSVMELRVFTLMTCAIVDSPKSRLKAYSVYLKIEHEQTCLRHNHHAEGF